MYIPKHLLLAFDSLTEAAKAYSEWNANNRPVGRPKTTDNGISLGDLKKMLKSNQTHQTTKKRYINYEKRGFKV